MGKYRRYFILVIVMVIFYSWSSLEPHVSAAANRTKITKSNIADVENSRQRSVIKGYLSDYSCERMRALC